MEILDANVSLLDFHPITKNDKSVGLYDKVTLGGDFYNDILRYGLINATIFPQPGVGVCQWINASSICTETFQSLASGESDFSLMTIAFEHYQNYELFPHLEVGPTSFQADKVFLSKPQVDASVIHVVFWNLIIQIPITILLLNFLTLIIGYKLINYRLRNSRMTWLDSLLLHTLRYPHFKDGWRRITIISLAFYCLFIHFFCSSQISADMVLSFPPYYITSLDEVVASNRTPFIFEALTVKYEFENSGKNNELILLTRARDRGSLLPMNFNSMMTMVQASNTGGVIFCESEMLALSMVATICLSQTEVSTRLAISPPFHKGFAGHMFSKKIPQKLKKRVHKVIQRFAEVGLYVVLNRDIIAKFEDQFDKPLERDRMVLCLLKMNRREERPTVTVQLSFKNFMPFNWFYLSGIGVSLFALLNEFLRSFLIKRRRRKKRSRKNGKLMINGRDQHFDWYSLPRDRQLLLLHQNRDKNSSKDC